MKKSKPNQSTHHKGTATMLSVLLVTVSVVSFFFIFTQQNSKKQVEGIATPAPILTCQQCVNLTGNNNSYLCLNKGDQNNQPYAHCELLGIPNSSTEICVKCPILTVTPIPLGIVSPAPSCIPRPGCLDSKFKCMIAEPVNGWCPTTPTPTHRPWHWPF